MSTTPCSAFQTWLRSRHPVATNRAVAKTLDRYGKPTSWSTAYRAFCKLGLRGRRRNSTRYEAFWNTINWQLPDSVLASIWRTERGNLHARRVRLNVGAPRWSVCKDRGNRLFIAAVGLERRKARRFDGPRPAGPPTATERRERQS